MSGRTSDELREVEERLQVLERLAEALDGGQLPLGASVVMDALAAAIPHLAEMGESGDRRAGQAATEAAEILVSLRTALGKFVERRRSVSFILRRGLIPALRNRRFALQQELASEAPPEPRAAGLLRKVARVVRLDLLFGRR